MNIPCGIRSRVQKTAATRQTPPADAYPQYASNLDDPASNNARSSVEMKLTATASNFCEYLTHSFVDSLYRSS